MHIVAKAHRFIVILLTLSEALAIIYASVLIGLAVESQRFLPSARLRLADFYV